MPIHLTPLTPENSFSLLAESKRHSLRFSLLKNDPQPILHDNLPLRLAFKKGKIFAGCCDIDPQALKYILEKYL